MHPSSRPMMSFFESMRDAESHLTPSATLDRFGQNCSLALGPARCIGSQIQHGAFQKPPLTIVSLFWRLMYGAGPDRTCNHVQLSLQHQEGKSNLDIELHFVVVKSAKQSDNTLSINDTVIALQISMIRDVWGWRMQRLAINSMTVIGADSGSCLSLPLILA